MRVTSITNVLLMLVLFIVLSIKVNAKEGDIENVIEVLLGCGSAEAEADIEQSIRGIKEDAIKSGILVVYKKTIVDCGYRLIQTGKNSQLLEGAYTDYDLWMQIEEYFSIERPKENKKYPGLGYPMD